MIQFAASMTVVIFCSFFVRTILDGLAFLWGEYTLSIERSAERQRQERIARDDAINARIEAEIAAGH